MKILVIGNGGREHALAWKLAQSPRVQVVFVAPGNGGTAQDKRLQNIAITEPQALADFAATEKVAFTVVGPEAPLAAGVVDVFRACGLKVFGPTKAAAQLESSKSFAKDFMQRHNIPTANYAVHTDIAAAKAYVVAQGAPIVIKADGLAAGKGVTVAMTLAEANAAIEDALSGNKFGAAGSRVVIEEFLQGEEASFIVLSDGKNVVPLASSQDHKRLLDGDQGPNTGGMGAYSPAPVVTPDVHARVMREIIMPTIRGMEADGMPFTGFLYAGLMIHEGKAKVIEFNARMGDPETQPIMMRLKSGLVEVMEHAVNGALDKVELQWDRRTALGVVIAAHGYPEHPRHADAIEGIPHETDNTMTFHAGTQLFNGVLRSTGGRVLCVTALGDSVKQAQGRAYEAIAAISMDGAQFRKDIGHRAVKR